MSALDIANKVLARAINEVSLETKKEYVNRATTSARNIRMQGEYDSYAKANNPDLNKRGRQMIKKADQRQGIADKIKKQLGESVKNPKSKSRLHRLDYLHDKSQEADERKAMSYHKDPDDAYRHAQRNPSKRTKRLDQAWTSEFRSERARLKEDQLDEVSIDKLDNYVVQAHRSLANDNLGKEKARKRSASAGLASIKANVGAYPDSAVAKQWSRKNNPRGFVPGTVKEADEYDDVQHGRTLQTKEWHSKQGSVYAKAAALDQARKRKAYARADSETLTDRIRRKVANKVAGRQNWEVTDKQYKKQRFRAAKRLAKSILSKNKGK